MAKLVKIYAENPSEREIERVVKVLESDGVVIYPTDGVYAFGALLRSAKAVERLRALSGKDDKLLSIVCSDISMVDKFAKVDNAQFKILKRNTPAPFTFILEPSSKVPDKALAGRKTVGVRIPDNNIPLTIVERLGFPMATASVKDADEIIVMNDGKITGISMISPIHSGGNAKFKNTLPDFLNSYKGVGKDLEGSVDKVSGATKSSVAMRAAMAEAFDYVESLKEGA